MQSIELEIDTLEKTQAIFGVNDEFVRVIEKKLGVYIVQRDSFITIKGESNANIETAADVIVSMGDLLDKSQTLNTDTVHRLVEEAINGTLKESCKVLGETVTLNSRGIPIRTRTMGQKSYINDLKNNTVTICIGPAGTGKTYLAVAYVAELYRRGEIERIVLSRPAIEAGEKLGFLPGDLQEKIDPYLRPLYDALNEVFGPEQVDKLRERNIIEVAPLAYMRGRTLSRCGIVIDEAQNATLPILKMALTRIGVGSKMILTGDITQIDLSEKGKESGLKHCAQILKNVEDVAVVKLNNRDVVRCKIVRDIVKAFEKEEEKRTPAGREKKYYPRRGERK